MHLGFEQIRVKTRLYIWKTNKRAWINNYVGHIMPVNAPVCCCCFYYGLLSCCCCAGVVIVALTPRRSSNCYASQKHQQLTAAFTDVGHIKVKPDNAMHIFFLCFLLQLMVLMSNFWREFCTDSNFESVFLKTEKNHVCIRFYEQLSSELFVFIS